MAAEPRRRRSRSLRIRLLIVLVALLALVSAMIGVVTAVALRGFLVGRLDSALSSAGGRSAGAGGPRQPGGGAREPQGAEFLLAPGQAAGTLGARLRSRKIDAAAVLNDGGSLKTLTAASVGALTSVPVDKHPHTLNVGTLGEFRVLAVRTSAR